MSPYRLRLVEDVIPAGHPPVYLPRLVRSLYLVSGSVMVEFADGAQRLAPESAWLGDEEVTLIAGEQEAVIWRWELVPANHAGGAALRSAPATRSTLKLEHAVELDPAFGWLIRCDRVQFPPGGVALTHVHQGPGIRCVLSGEITIETEGQKHVHAAGDAWFEIGHSPVLAPTTEDMATTFIRCFLLPRACHGRSSIRYVLPEDAGKAKSQRYDIFGERFFDLPRVVA